MSLLALIFSLATTLSAEDRITLPIDDSQRATLPGHMNPRIKAAVDQGPVDASMPLPYILMMLQPSPSQQAALTRLLAQQQDASSPDYHRWLTPDQYAAQFGAGQADIDKITAWLGRHGLTVKSVGRGRNAIAFGGTAGQVQNAFGAAIHRYLVGTELHYANNADPTVPAAFEGLVLAIHGLDDFRWKPRLRRALEPRYDIDGSHALAPGDIAAIYDITPLYDAGIDGAGQKLAIVGQTEIEMADIEQYRSEFGLPANDPTTLLVPGSPNPGVQSSSGDLMESDLDLELSGAVARNATILFVYSTDAFGSFQYVIEENLAPVIGISYGGCELQMPSSEVQALESVAEQANAQGQTIFAASGDTGALDCSGGDNTATNNSLSVDMPASLPEVTGVGGTELVDGSGNFWSASNSTNGASALSYIPETAWNDGVLTGQSGGPQIDASGGGVSVYFSKPSWQTGTGVPNDGFRDVPDVAISASPQHDPYVIYTGGQASPIGGTSVGPPQFAGLAVLLGQYLVANGYQSSTSLGNINPVLYTLARTSGVFHDITTGNNDAPACGATSCVGPAVGYNAGIGYDQVTGLGTPDVNNLFTAWRGSGIVTKSAVSMAFSANPTRVAFTGTSSTVVLSATVTSTSGGTPTGTVTFLIGSETLGAATLNSSGVATLTIGGVQLAVGANTITAQYSGDTANNGASATANVIETSPTNGTPSIASASNSASFTQAFAPGGILSIFGSLLAPVTASAVTLPLPTMLAGASVTINDVPSPLYYVSPSQLNVQIPYEATANSSLSLRVYNNGVSAFQSLTISAAAPAIFTTNSSGSGQGAILDTAYQLVDTSHPATPGSTYLQIYCMGLGAVSNQPADGAPASATLLAKTVLTPTVTIGGVDTTPSFSGLAPGFVGLYQVNALVPATVAAGSAVPVVISVNGTASNTVTIVVGQASTPAAGLQTRSLSSQQPQPRPVRQNQFALLHQHPPERIVGNQ